MTGPAAGAISSARRLILRSAAALLGGYAFTWGFTSLVVAGQVALGVDFHEAEMGVMLIAFLVFLCAFLWSFAAGRIGIVWAVLVGGGAVMTVLALALQRVLLS